MSGSDNDSNGGSDAGEDVEVQDTGADAEDDGTHGLAAGDHIEYNEEVKATRLTPCEAGSLKKSHIAILKGHPCKIMDIKTSKTGKHGHAKCNITGICQLTGKKFNEVKPSHAPMFFARVDKYDFTFSYIKDDLVVAMDSKMEEREIKADDETRDKITALEGELTPDEEIVVTVLIAPMANPDEVVQEVVVGVKKQKATA